MNKLFLEKSLFTKLIGIGITLALIIITIPPGRAQDNESGWTFPQRVPGFLDDTYTPVLISDKNGTVHAFASQWVGEDDRQLAIVYSKWTLEGGWTTPVDVILLPGVNSGIFGAFLDKDGMMHIVFRRGEAASGNLYYSRAPIALADRATSWSEPKIIGKNAIYPSSAALAGDSNGNLIAIYGGQVDWSGVYAIQSSDAGETWSEPTPIFFTDDPAYIPYSIHMVVDSSNQMHATWNVVDSIGNDISLHYARYDVETGSWAEPIQLDERVIQGDSFGPSFPSIAESDGEVVVMYNNGNPYPNSYVGLGRPVQMVRVSKDNGQTWSEPTLPSPRHQGRSGEHSLAVDSNGVVHATFIQRIDRSINGQYLPIGGVWHSEYRDSRWSEPERIRIPIAASNIRLVVCQGNVLLAVWIADQGVGQYGVWYSYKLLDAPEAPLQPLPVPVVEATFTQTATINSTQAISPEPPQLSAANLANFPPPGNQSHPGMIIFVALVPVVLIVAGVVLIRRYVS